MHTKLGISDKICFIFTQKPQSLQKLICDAETFTFLAEIAVSNQHSAFEEPFIQRVFTHSLCPDLLGDR
jgi:hypothetical protein